MRYLGVSIAEVEAKALGRGLARASSLLHTSGSVWNVTFSMVVVHSMWVVGIGC